MQETNVSISQFYRIRKYFVGCWFEDGWASCSWLLGCGDRSVTFIEEYLIRNPWSCRKLLAKSQFQTQQKGNRDVDQLSHVDYVTTNAKSSQGGSQLYIFEDDEAVIKMIIKGTSPTMRHVSRTHRDALDWFIDRRNLDPKIQINFVDTTNQHADMLTKGSFTRDEWNHLLRLLNIMNFNDVLSQPFLSFK